MTTDNLDSASVNELVALAKSARATIDALRRALPSAFKGNRWGVLLRNSATPDIPIAVFTHEDHAYSFAIATYGTFNGLDFSIRTDVEVVPVGSPAVQ